jgi:aerobic-type carbon monoxide dehydrogenase small subunit (CoxS/CutS family)
MAEQMSMRVDGREHTIEADPKKPLLYTLRDELGLNNPRFGCGLAQCGACTVHLNGRPTRSCVTPTSAAKGAEITTIAGIGTPEKPHPLQTAYVEEQVPQCGYCTNGFLMTGAALLKAKPNPTDTEIRKALTGLKCRCGTHMSILRAMKAAAAKLTA